MIKKILSFAFILLISLLLVRSVSAQLFDPQEEFAKDSPVPLPGITCGMADSKANQCCGKSTAFHIDEGELNNLIEKIQRGEPLNRKEEGIVVILFYVDEDSGGSGIGNLLTEAIIDALINGRGSLTQEEKAGWIQMLRRNSKTLNNMSATELLKLQVRIQYSGENNKCLIDAGPINGFCFDKWGQFFVGLVGDNANTFLNISKNSTIEPCVYGIAEGKGNQCKCISKSALSALCTSYLRGSGEYSQCVQCTENKGGLWTGAGCLRVTTAGFIQDTLLGLGVGIAGIVAILCIIYSAILLQTSGGSPERIKKAREYLTNCIIGLLIIIFSVFILRLIGVNILQIPGFGG